MNRLGLKRPVNSFGLGGIEIVIDAPVTGGGSDLYYRKEGFNLKQEDEEMIIILSAFMEMTE